jgi:aspartate racemase
VVLCTNTMHRVYDAIRAAVTIPVLHIADGTADPLDRAGYRTVGLLGTRYTMEQDFYRSRLTERGFTVVTPDAEQRDLVHEVIYTELCLGKVLDHSREAYLEVVESLARRGAEAVILGCTEIGLLLNEANCPLPVFDTTLLHVEAALDWALDPTRVSAGAS